MDVSGKVLAAVFWLCAGLVVYAYAGYPLALMLLARIRPWPVKEVGPPPRSVAIVLAARNEEQNICRRIGELRSALESCGMPGQLIVVSDGSDDRTAQIAAEGADSMVRVIELKENVGKATALNRGCEAAAQEIIVFADARQTWASDALEHLLSNFADRSVGAVSGELVLQDASGVMGGVGLYWRYEKWLRKLEGRTYSTVGVTGAISAVRKQLFRPIEEGIILDDVWWPMVVAMQGYRVVFEEHARAYDRLPEKAHDEFRRKVRTLCGNFQLLGRLPRAMLPWRNPIWWRLMSHKVLRLMVPWAMLVTLVLSVVMTGRCYRVAMVIQVAGYALALSGLATGAGSRYRIVSAASSFLVLNAAGWVAFWVWISGQGGRSWGKVKYKPDAAGNLAQAELR